MNSIGFSFGTLQQVITSIQQQYGKKMLVSISGGIIGRTYTIGQLHYDTALQEHLGTSDIFSVVEYLNRDVIGISCENDDIFRIKVCENRNYVQRH